MRLATNSCFAAMIAMGVASAASAVPLSASWAPVPNAINPITGEATGLDGDWLTFDLFAEIEPSDVCGALDFGAAGANAGISTDGEFYQVEPPFGSDSAVQNLSFAEFHPTIAFDTAVAMNDEDLAFAAPMVWNTGGVTGAWYSSAKTAVGGPLWIARITISSNSTYLGGQMFVSAYGANGETGSACEFVPEICVVTIPNAIPAPGVAVVIAMGLFPISRRNRQQEESR